MNRKKFNSKRKSESGKQIDNGRITMNRFSFKDKGT